MSASKQKSEASKSSKMRIRAFPVSVHRCRHHHFPHKFHFILISLNRQQWMKNT